MGIITVRLNDKEEKILEHLQEFYDTDKSKILKEAMVEKFEDLRDREVIENYEKKLKAGTVQFVSADSIFKKIKGR
jgi:predicted DNA-binding protein